ncbi:LysR family transcriptional regulator [Lactobacillus alvi]|uniref:LysR family transcriptional regulator n=1 Tax=Limosilactobacillus alvi TaxID=990412 RepID=A0ABS2EMM8_9LACO|nr:LysR family transcriptional regulator [Limosilactobacillus alvi]MBM6753616.1 LysR family transcriptional regulator [Limosilactobacillus alvi]
MLDNYLLAELVAFAHTGTIAQAADHLGVSQPAITRGLHKIEAELGVPLFIRQPNKLTLNPTGEFAAKQAAKVLAANQALVTDIQHFAQSQATITVGAVAPGPLIVLRQITAFPVEIKPDFFTEDQALMALQKGQVACVVTQKPIQNPQVKAEFLGTENLLVNLNRFSPLASQKQVTFKQLAGLSFIVIDQIGVWAKLIKKAIPDAKFIYQNQDNFLAIVNNSIFPFFTTNLSHFDRQRIIKLGDRVPIPIQDQSAHMDFYVNYLKVDAKRVAPLIEAWRSRWT